MNIMKLQNRYFQNGKKGIKMLENCYCERSEAIGWIDERVFEYFCP